MDRSSQQGFDVSKVATEDLPEEMRKMTLEEKTKWIAAKKAERLDIQAKIRDLAEKRRAFVKGEMEKQGLDDTKALDKVVRDAIREQAGAKGFSFDAPPAPKAPEPAPAK